MLYSIRCKRALLHDTDAAPGQRNYKGPVTKSIELTSKGESGVAEESDSENGLFEPNCIVEVLSQSLLPVMVDINSRRIYEVFLNYPCLDQRFGQLLDPAGCSTYVFPYSCSYKRKGLKKLISSPHVPVSEEKLGPSEFGFGDSGLDCHLDEVSSEGPLLHLKALGLVVIKLLFLVEIVIAGHSNSEAPARLVLPEGLREVVGLKLVADLQTSPSLQLHNFPNLDQVVSERVSSRNVVKRNRRLVQTPSSLRNLALVELHSERQGTGNLVSEERGRRSQEGRQQSRLLLESVYQRLEVLFGHESLHLICKKIEFLFH